MFALLALLATILLNQSEGFQNNLNNHLISTPSILGAQRSSRVISSQFSVASEARKTFSPSPRQSVILQTKGSQSVSEVSTVLYQT